VYVLSKFIFVRKIVNIPDKYLHYSFIILTFAPINQTNMAKKVLSSIGMCEGVADKLFRTKISKEAILTLLRSMWHSAQGEGYSQKTKEIRDRRETRERKLESSWKNVLTEIEDKTHGREKYTK